MIAYECPHCRESLEAPTQSCGALTACDHCGVVIQIPVILDGDDDLSHNG